MFVFHSSDSPMLRNKRSPGAVQAVQTAWTIPVDRAQ
ncbi:MAG: hypothetical protein JW388_0462 [Nitrospira sp.]|nr:hypothetical protein [Nitrospira sp.]